MRARERRENKLARVRRSVVDLHSRYSLVKLGDLGHIAEIKLGIYSLRKHIERNGYDIGITRSLTVSEKRSLNSVAARKQSHFGVCYRTAAVVVGVKRDKHVFSVLEIIVHILNLICVDVRHRDLDGYGQVDDHLPLCCGLPYIKHRVADLKREFGLCTRKRLGRILVTAIDAVFLTVPLADLCALDRNVDYLLLALLEDLLSLCYRGRVIEVHDRALDAFKALKGLFDDMLARLCKHLHGDVIGDKILLDERAQKGIFGLACRGKSDLDLLEAYFHEKLEKFELFLKAHGNYERLIAITKVNRAPHGRLLYVILRHPTRCHVGCRKKLSCVFV